MALGLIKVGRWAKRGDAFEIFEPLDTQPPVDVATDINKVEAWLADLGVEETYALIRPYALQIKVHKITKVKSERV